MAALYDEKDANLFDDIVYPIIGYSVSSLAEKHQEEKHYYNVQDVQEFIKEEAGILIPIAIVSQALSSIQNNNQDIEISIIDKKGQHFSIQRTWGAVKHSRISRKAQSLQQKKEELEVNYQSYLKRNSCESKVTVEDFLQKNMEEALAYMDGKEAAYISEEHVHVAKFIAEIRQKNPELYDVICDIAWGAIVAGLLLAENTGGIQKPNANKTEYFLDTPIVMAALDLSRKSNVDQAKDLIRVIGASGGVIRVHPVTLDEIDSILSSVLKEGKPSVANELAEAYERRDLTPRDIQGIKGLLKAYVEKAGISAVIVDKKERDQMLSSCDKRLVKKLAERRGSERVDSFRELHDICLWEYVSKRTKGLRDSKKLDAYLITTNRDLIRLTKESLGFSRRDCLMSPDSLILQLWMSGGGLRSEMKKEVLSAKLTKCFVANDVDTAHRLGKVITCYGENASSSISEGLLAVLYEALANREPAFLQLTDKLMGSTDEEANRALSSQIIVKASKESDKRKEALAEERRTESQKRESLEEKVRQVKSIQKEREHSLTEQNRILKEKSQLDVQIRDLERERDLKIYAWRRWVPPIMRWVLMLAVFGGCYFYTRSKDVSQVLAACTGLITLAGGEVLMKFLLKVIKPAWAIAFMRGEEKQKYMKLFAGFVPIPRQVYIEQRRERWADKNPQYKKLSDKVAQLERKYEELSSALSDDVEREA